MPVLLDTSVLIAESAPGGADTAAISVVSLAELHFGLLVTEDASKRAERATRLGMIEARFPYPLPVDDRIARDWGRLQAIVRTRGGQPRTRQADLILAATARVHGATLLTHNLKDFELIADIVDVAGP